MNNNNYQLIYFIKKPWEILAEKGLKVTPQRVLIYELLLSDLSHPTAECLHEQLKHEHPSISLATVYKTLETLVEHELARKVATEAGTFRYDGKTREHHHIILEETNEIIDFEDHEMLSLIKNHLRTQTIENLDITSISIQIKGRKKDLSKSIQVNNSQTLNLN